MHLTPVTTRPSPAQPDDSDDHDQDDGQPSRPGHTAYRRGADNPDGSTTALRADVLTALGVLKVATADQLQRLLRPGAASNKAIRQALGDLAPHGLIASTATPRTGTRRGDSKAPPGWTPPLRCSGWSARRRAVQPGAPAAPAPSTRWRPTRPCSPSSSAAPRPGPRAEWADGARLGPPKPNTADQHPLQAERVRTERVPGRGRILLGLLGRAWIPGCWGTSRRGGCGCL